jgi:L-ribulose-5-phosphate 4-epimerase
MLDQLGKMLLAFIEMATRPGLAEDTHGNLSCRDVNLDDCILIKPSGIPYIQIERPDVRRVRLSDGSTFREDGCIPSVDTPHHLSIYRRYPDVSSICHTHSPYATAWAITGNTMHVCCTEHADYFGHRIRCLPFASLDVWGDRVSLLPGEQAVLLGQHGVLVLCRDPDPRKAVALAAAVESIAKKYTLASSLSDVLSIMDHDEVEKWHDRYTNRYGQ